MPCLCVSPLSGFSSPTLRRPHLSSPPAYRICCLLTLVHLQSARFPRRCPEAGKNSTAPGLSLTPITTNTVCSLGHRRRPNPLSYCCVGGNLCRYISLPRHSHPRSGGGRGKRMQLRNPIKLGTGPMAVYGVDRHRRGRRAGGDGLASKHQIYPGCGKWRADAGRDIKPNLFHKIKIVGADGDREESSRERDRENPTSLFSLQDWKPFLVDAQSGKVMATCTHSNTNISRTGHGRASERRNDQLFGVRVQVCIFSFVVERNLAQAVH